MSAKSPNLRPPVPAEREVLKAILETLAHLGVPCWRSNTGATTATHDGQSRFIRFGTPGSADIHALIPPAGRFCGIEVKRPGKRPTTAQLAWLKAVNEAGGFAFWADSAERAEHVIRAVLRHPRFRIEIDSNGDPFLTDEELT